MPNKNVRRHPLLEDFENDFLYVRPGIPERTVKPLLLSEPLFDR